jgi:hypothetical protein
MTGRKEIELRIEYLESELHRLMKLPKRLHKFNHDKHIAELKGEIKGLEWALRFAFTKPDPNLIEQ